MAGLRTHAVGLIHQILPTARRNLHMHGGSPRHADAARNNVAQREFGRADFDRAATTERQRAVDVVGILNRDAYIAIISSAVGSSAATNSAPADAKAQVRSSSYATTNVSWNINSSHSSVYRQRMLVQSNIDRMVAAPPQLIDLGRQTRWSSNYYIGAKA